MRKKIFYFIAMALFTGAILSSYKGNDVRPAPAGVNTAERERIVTAKMFRQMNVEEMQVTVDNAKKLGVVNQIQLLARQVFVEGIPEILTNSGIDLWLIATIFYHDDNGGAIVSGALGRPPRWAICNDGEIAQQQGSWLRMVCPNDHEYLDYRIEYIKDALRRCHFTGVSLDFIRHFVFWERVYEGTDPNTLRNACFCDACLADFTQRYNVTITGNTTVEKASFILGNTTHANNWTNYKCATIDRVIEKILADLRTEFPHLKANIHGVPWGQNDFDGAIRKIAGQDFALLSQRVDQISLMTYNRTLQRPPQWLNDVTADVVNTVNGKVAVCPTLQGSGGTDEEFEAELISAIKAPTSGVVIWQFDNRFTEARLEIMKRVLTGSE